MLSPEGTVDAVDKYDLYFSYALLEYQETEKRASAVETRAVVILAVGGSEGCAGCDGASF